jgi:carbonic anhydrase
VTALTPAIKGSAGQPGDALDNAIKQNVILTVEKLKSASPIIDKFVTDKKVKVVGGVYRLDTGKVELLS